MKENEIDYSSDLESYDEELYEFDENEPEDFVDEDSEYEDDDCEDFDHSLLEIVKARKSKPKKKTKKKSKAKELTPQQRASVTRRFKPETKLLILKAFQDSQLRASVFGSLVGVAGKTIYAWMNAFKKHGPAGLENRKPGPDKGSRLSVATQQAILMLKDQNPEWGCQRIHDMLLRSEAFSASPGAIKRVLLENDYEVVEEGRRRHPDKPRSFERARPQQMYQTDIFTFMLKRQRTRVYMIAYMDDHSRYIVSFGLTLKATSSWAQEVLGEAIASYGPPEEVLTDQGPQYHSWRGTSAFRKFVTKCGIKQIVARAHHPQTLGKVERFWQTLWNECIEKAIFKDLQDAKDRIGQFVGWYNFRRTHQGIDGMFPADRFFSSDSTIRKTIEERVEANALEIARHGTPRKPFYLSGRVGDQSISLHAEGEKVVLTRDNGEREEVDLSSTGRPEDIEQIESIEDVPCENNDVVIPQEVAVALNQPEEKDVPEEDTAYQEQLDALIAFAQEKGTEAKRGNIDEEATSTDGGGE